MRTISRVADVGVVGFAQQSAGISIADPANFWQFDFEPLFIQLASLQSSTLKPKRFAQPLLSGAGLLGDAFEEVLVGSVEVTQGLLLASLNDSGDSVVFFSKDGQFPRLANITEVAACSCLEVAPMFALLLKSNIVDKATHTSKLREQGRLFLGGCSLKR